MERQMDTASTSISKEPNTKANGEKIKWMEPVDKSGLMEHGSKDS